MTKLNSHCSGFLYNKYSQQNRTLRSGITEVPHPHDINFNIKGLIYNIDPLVTGHIQGYRGILYIVLGVEGCSLMITVRCFHIPQRGRWIGIKVFSVVVGGRGTNEPLSSVFQNF
jgi:hypothetical protein